MYIPEAFKITDETVINQFIQENPFAILTSCESGKIEVTHLPIVRLHDGKLYGHISISNCHANIDVKQEICLIFNAEEAYISPSFYESDFNVPTWNYSSVVIYGKVRYIDDSEKVWSLLDEFTKVFEGKYGWKLPQSGDYKELTKYLRLFEVEVVIIEAKFKFSQNKSNEDREKVMMSLDKYGQKKVADFMRSVNRL